MFVDNLSGRTQERNKKILDKFVVHETSSITSYACKILAFHRFHKVKNYKKILI